MVIRRNHPSGVTIQPSIASVMEGENLDLNCIIPGTSPASVKWSRAGGLLSSNHQVLSPPTMKHMWFTWNVWQIFELSVKYMNHMCACMCMWLKVLGTRLRILQASADDTGEYICQVEDGPFSRQASVSVSVTSSSSRKSPRLMTNRKVSMAITFTLQIFNQTWYYVGRGSFIMLSNVIYLHI